MEQALFAQRVNAMVKRAVPPTATDQEVRVRDLPSAAVLDEDHTLEQVKAMSRELLSPPGSSLRCALRSKKSAWLMTALRLSTPKGLVMIGDGNLFNLVFNRQMQGEGS